jgi:hypothetical protein
MLKIIASLFVIAVVATLAGCAGGPFGAEARGDADYTACGPSGELKIVSGRNVAAGNLTYSYTKSQDGTTTCTVSAGANGLAQGENRSTDPTALVTNVGAMVQSAMTGQPIKTTPPPTQVFFSPPPTQQAPVKTVVPPSGVLPPPDH